MKHPAPLLSYIPRACTVCGQRCVTKLNPRGGQFQACPGACGVSWSADDSEGPWGDPSTAKPANRWHGRVTSRRAVLVARARHLFGMSLVEVGAMIDDLGLLRAEAFLDGQRRAV